MKAGWSAFKLCELTYKVTDGSHNPSKGVEFSENLMLSSKNVFDDALDYESPRYLSDKDYLQENKRTQITSGDVLLTIVGTIGRVAVVPPNAPNLTLQRSVAVIKPIEDKITSRFLMYRLIEQSEQLNSQARGVAQKGIYLETLREIEIYAPPIQEQQRIVAILDKAFEQIAFARANTEKNLQNARALFESYLQSVFTHRGVGWEEKRLGNVVTRLTNGYVGPTRNIYNDSGVPYLLARHVKNNQLIFDGKTFITEEFNRKNKKSILKEDDVLLVQSGHIGHSAAVTKEHEGHNCHAMIVISPVKGEFIGPFLSLFFNSSEMKKRFQEIRSGSTVPHLTCREVKELMVPLPNVATQQVIVNRVREFQEAAQRLESLYQRKLDALGALKKSLLHQAFAGEL